MTIFLSSAITWRTNRPMARNGFEDPDPWPSPLTGVDGAFWLEFTSGLSDLLVGLAHPAGTSRPEEQGRQDSNLQPAVLETAALPIAPLPFARRTSRGPAPSGEGGASGQRSAYKPPGPGANRLRSDHRPTAGRQITPRRPDQPEASPAGRPAIRPARVLLKPSDAVASALPLTHDGEVTTDDAPQTAPSSQRSRISTRVGAIAPSATLAVDATAKELKAAGRPVIGFGAGEPDFPTPAHIVEAAIEAAPEPANHRYSPGAGQPALRQAIADSVSETSQLSVEPAQVLVTNGGKQAVYQTFATLLDPGDEVLLPAPYWTTYPEAIRLAGAREVAVLAGSDQGYLPTIEQLEAARTDATRAVVICSPSNPTGAVMTAEQIGELGRWAHRNGLWVITDEIYQHLTYDGVPFVSVLSQVPELAETTVVLGGVAKTFAMTGWRVGWMVGPQDVIAAASNLQSHLTSNVNNIAQHAAIAALTGPMDAVEE